jgi:hypothetical protein
VTCAQQKCSAEINTAFGADYKSGACANLATCLNACACGSTGATCVGNCETPNNLTAACQQAFSAVGTCTDQNCANACPTGAGGNTSAGGATGSGGATGAACTSLAQCCVTINSALQSECLQVVASGNGPSCSAFQSAECTGAGAGGIGAGGTGVGASGTGTGGTGTAAACTTLAECCTTIGPTLQTACLQVVANGDGPTCSEFQALECTGGGAGGTGAGGTGSTTANWDCTQETDGSCVCVNEPGLPAMNTCTTPMEPCCFTAVVGGYSSCECEPTDTVTCPEWLSALAGTQVSTCPPP